MTDIISSTVLSFLKERIKPNTSVLLAFSGGPDSLALLHALLDFKRKHPLELALAHVDHGWRPESEREANELSTMAERLGLKLHKKRLACEGMEGNLEAACRQERLNFFADLCREHSYEAVLLGHHADDQAETVLKRLLEGGGLSGVGGIAPARDHNGMKLWRPLLSVTKKQILAYLKERGLEGLHDRTNDDPKYMRARMRTQGLPFLAEMFGKEISANLCHIGQESAEVSDYLDAKVAGILAGTIVGPWGALLDLGQTMPTHSLELKHVIRRFCEQVGLALSRASLAQAVEHMIKRDANKQLNRLYIDRGRLFILTTDRADWKVEIECSEETECTDWRGLWKGQVFAVVPAGDYKFLMPEASWKYSGGTTLDKWWTEHKVPSILRYFAPVIMSEEGVVHEFLTGKVKKYPEVAGLVKISLDTCAPPS